jgi:hypothetical protein
MFVRLASSTAFPVNANAIINAKVESKQNYYHLGQRNVSICTLEDNLKSVKV